MLDIHFKSGHTGILAIISLLREIQQIARESVEDLPPSVNLYWLVTDKDVATVNIQVATVPEVEATPAEFELSLSAAGTTWMVMLNKQDVSSQKYRGLIALAVAGILRHAAADAVLA